MSEKPTSSKDVSDMLDTLARRMRDDPSFDLAAHLTVAPPQELLDEGPSLGPVDVFTDERAVTVTVEARNTEPSNVQVSLLEGRLLIALGKAFRRDLALPAAVDEESAVATFRNGVLDVVLPLKRR
ncbi:MAG TPA: Hsp20/alpha crystallin family protein [Candidatus Thermoplasmatota archaeon]|nr:Hsp20/alpha crystallin family protein [Candidatus Thermoplasmatota archaeon]